MSEENKEEIVFGVTVADLKNLVCPFEIWLFDHEIPILEERIKAIGCTRKDYFRILFLEDTKQIRKAYWRDFESEGKSE